MELTDHLIEIGVAQNKWQADNIIRGLQLDNLPTIEAKCERAKLYRSWRVRGESSADARAKAIAGVKPRLTNEERGEIMHNLGFDKE